MGKDIGLTEFGKDVGWIYVTDIDWDSWNWYTEMNGKIRETER